MDWKKVKLPPGSKLLKVHNFTFMHSSGTFALEVDELADGTFMGHGEHATDKAQTLASVSGASLEDCINALIQKIQTRK